MNTNQAHLIDYYEAFEALLTYNRNVLGEYRTHFGMMDEVGPDYCWFKAVARAREFPAQFSDVLRAMDKMHQLMFREDLSEKRVLDVGFGTGGTLRKLAETHSSAEIEGINLNPVQFEIGQNFLRDLPNTRLHCGDIYDHPLRSGYDLLYFIESAFHMPDKPALRKRIADLLGKGGEVMIVDIFYPDALYERIRGRGTGEAIFDYQSIKAWTQGFQENGLQVTEFHDLSPLVANHITIRMTEAEFMDDIVAKLTEGHPRAEAYAARLLEAFRGYRRLSKVLGKGSMIYGILKAKKA